MKLKIIFFLQFFIFGISLISMQNLHAEDRITRIDAVEALLDTVIRASGTEFISWDNCYVEDGSGG
ncbi:MAG: hypothetical protein LBU32_31950 [Clostridiales bacterium]|nr:hypothetical protein [Clostridiales bacterium]